MINNNRLGLLSLLQIANELRLSDEYVNARFGRRNALFGAVVRLAAYARRAVLGIFRGSRQNSQPLKESKILFFSSTANQTKALLDIVALLQDKTFLGINHRHEAIVEMPLREAFLISIAMLPLSICAIIGLLCKSGFGGRYYKLRAVLLSIDELILTPGYVFAVRKILAKVQPSVVVMSNDHNTINRCYCLVAKEMCIETVYIQHAPVSTIFPSLIFDVAFLDGEASAEVYRQKSDSSRLHLVGAARYDRYNFTGMPKPMTEEGPVVGLAYNKVSNICRLQEYVDRLLEAGFRVVVRPHPSISMSEIPMGLRKLVDSDDVLMHLKRIDVCISSASGVLLDALMAGVIPLQAKDLSDIGDYYGYERFNVVVPCDLDSVVEIVRALGPSTYRSLLPGSVYFNAAIKTKARVSSTIANFLLRRVGVNSSAS